MRSDGQVDAACRVAGRFTASSTRSMTVASRIASARPAGTAPTTRMVSSQNHHAPNGRIAEAWAKTSPARDARLLLRPSSRVTGSSRSGLVTPSMCSSGRERVRSSLRPRRVSGWPERLVTHSVPSVACRGACRGASIARVPDHPPRTKLRDEYPRGSWPVASITSGGPGVPGFVLAPKRATRVSVSNRIWSTHAEPWGGTVSGTMPPV